MDATPTSDARDDLPVLDLGPDAPSAPTVMSDGVDGPIAGLDEFEPETPPLIDEDGRVRLSFTRVEAYRTCPLKFRFAYIDRLPGQPAPALSFGSSIHAALEDFYDRKLPEPPTEQDLLRFLYDRWDRSGFVGMERSEELAYYRHAQDVLRRFHRRAVADYRLPVDTEKWFELPVGDNALVVGSIDRVDVDDAGSFHVVDYKTNRRVKDRAAVAGSLQLSLYALACEWLYGTLPASVCLDFVVPGVEIRVPLADLDLDAARTAVTETADAVIAGHYGPKPTSLCGWCDFRAVCPAWQGEGPDVLGPAQSEVARLRREARRNVRQLRELETGVARIQAELDDALRMPARAGRPAPAVQARLAPEARGSSDGAGG